MINELNTLVGFIVLTIILQLWENIILKLLQLFFDGVYNQNYRWRYVM